MVIARQIVNSISFAHLPFLAAQLVVMVSIIAGDVIGMCTP